MDNFDNVLVIDADGHVYEGNVDLAPRMPEKWRSQAPIRLERQRRQLAYSARKAACGRRPKDLAPAYPGR